MPAHTIIQAIASLLVVLSLGVIVVSALIPAPRAPREYPAPRHEWVPDGPTELLDPNRRHVDGT